MNTAAQGAGRHRSRRQHGAEAVHLRWRRAASTLERHRDSIEAYEGLCNGIGEEAANVALAWLLHQPGVTRPIIGPRTVDQLEDPVRAVELTLDDEVLKHLDAIFPGYGPAPDY
jgi:aryl-alcohol dehydrogenase-like predicted oxidoreductase